MNTDKEPILRSKEIAEMDDQEDEKSLRSRATVTLFHKFTPLTQSDEEDRTR